MPTGRNGVVARFGSLIVTESSVWERTRGARKSALLHQVNGVMTSQTRLPWLLSIVPFGMGLALVGATQSDFARLALVLLGGVLTLGAVLVYALVREVTLAVCAGNVTLVTSIEGKSMDDAEDFIVAVENAKLAWEDRHGR